jgi:hypothetical protein
MIRSVPITVVLATLVTSAAQAGTYFPMEFYARRAPEVPPFAIVHPPGYTGAGGTLEVRVCIDPSPPQNPGDPDNSLLAGPLEWALGVWDRLEPMVNNCGGRNNCSVWEDSSFPEGKPHLASVLLHELGHCAMGLGHPDFRELEPDNPDDQPFFQPEPVPLWFSGVCNVDNNGCCFEYTSFTNSVNAKDISLGTGGVRGDRQNSQTNNCPTAGLASTAETVEAEPTDWLRRFFGCSPGGVPYPFPAQCCPQNPFPTSPISVLSLATL